ncbi:MAG: response regulator transcription factor [Candidatus Odinarchaeota archaeon]
MRLFIADDSTILRERLIDILSEIKGIEFVGQEGNVSNVLDAVVKIKPDIVILDIRMPGGNGIKVLDTIKKKIENPPIVIMFTNFPDLQYRKKCFDAGADYFFYKSTEFEKLIDVIRESSQFYKEKKQSRP